MGRMTTKRCTIPSPMHSSGNSPNSWRKKVKLCISLAKQPCLLHTTELLFLLDTSRAMVMHANFGSGAYLLPRGMSCRACWRT